MRLVSALAIACGLLLASVPAVLAAPGRADTFYTFNCIDPDGNPITAESVDARSIEQGGKLMGSAHWASAHPDYECWVEGPFSNESSRTSAVGQPERRYDRTHAPSTVGESLPQRP